MGRLAIIAKLRPQARWVQGLWHSAAPLAMVAAIAVVFLPLSRPYDLDVFLRAGYAALHGLHVYPSPQSPAVYSGLSFVYPYSAAWPFMPLAALPPGAGTAVFFAISAAAVIAACLIAAKSDPWPAVLVLCTTFTITGLQLGALNPLLFAGTVFLWKLRDRPIALALLAAPVVASKLFLLPLLAWLIWARRYRAFAWASMATLALLAAGFALGPLNPIQYLHLLSQLGDHEARSGFSLIGALMNAGFPRQAGDAAAGALALALFACAYGRYRHTRDERILFCAGILASLVLTPVLWSHYLVLLAAVLLALNARRRWFLLLALASWAISLPHGIQETDLTEVGRWLAVAGSLLVIGYSALPVRKHSHATAPADFA